MNIEERKKVIVVQKYIVSHFEYGDWSYFGQLTESSETIQNHKRLIRSLANQDDDYPHCVGEVLMKIIQANPTMMDNIIDYYDIEEWYSEIEPKRAAKLFPRKVSGVPSFWENGYLRIFISHLAISKTKAVALKEALGNWGMSSFVAHEDIEPTKEWMSEIELALGTMDVLVAMVEPNFRASNWTDQEVGFALGRGVEIIPLRLDADPHGFMGKYQGFPAKGKKASEIAKEILKIILKKNRIRQKVVGALSLAMSGTAIGKRVDRIQELDKMASLSSQEMKEILERVGLSTSEMYRLRPLVSKYKAFEDGKTKVELEDDLPF